MEVVTSYELIWITFQAQQDNFCLVVRVLEQFRFAHESSFAGRQSLTIIVAYPT